MTGSIRAGYASRAVDVDPRPGLGDAHAVHEERGTAPARARGRGVGGARTRRSSARTRRSGASTRSSTTSTTRSTRRSTSTRRTARRSSARRASPRRSSRRCCRTRSTSRMPRDTPLKKTLFACDELSGLRPRLRARAARRDRRTLEPKSVRKKLKQPSFAAGVHRDEVYAGAERARRRARRAHRERRRGAAADRARARAAAPRRASAWRSSQPRRAARGRPRRPPADRGAHEVAARQLADDRRRLRPAARRRARVVAVGGRNATSVACAGQRHDLDARCEQLAAARGHLRRTLERATPGASSSAASEPDELRHADPARVEARRARPAARTSPSSS